MTFEGSPLFLEESHLLTLCSLFGIIWGYVCLYRGEVSCIRFIRSRLSRCCQAGGVIPCSTPHQLPRTVLLLFPICCLQSLSGLTEPGHLSSSNRIIHLMVVDFFPALKEHYQLVEQTGKHKHKTALEQRGDRSPDCFFQQSPIFD